MLFIFYDISSERYQDLIISFLSFGWSILFFIGFLDEELKPGIQMPILSAGVMGICGLIRARMEVRGHSEITYEIISLSIFIFLYVLSLKRTKRA